MTFSPMSCWCIVLNKDTLEKFGGFGSDAAYVFDLEMPK